MLLKLRGFLIRKLIGRGRVWWDEKSDTFAELDGEQNRPLGTLALHTLARRLFEAEKDQLETVLKGFVVDGVDAGDYRILVTQTRAPGQRKKGGK